MGIDCVNTTVRIHIEEGSDIPNVVPNDHKGTANIDVNGPDIGITGLAALINATTSQSAFDSAATSAWGTWYTARPAAWRTGCYTMLRQLRLAL